jgi:hypothetical protein
MQCRRPWTRAGGFARACRMPRPPLLVLIPLVLVAKTRMNERDLGAPIDSTEGDIDVRVGTVIALPSS